MKLKKVYSRKYVSENDDLSNLEILKDYIDRLKNADVSTAESLEKFIQNMDEVFSIVDDASSRSYVNMTIDTSNKEAEKKYLYIIEKINPVIEEASFEFARKIMESPSVNSLDRDRYKIFLRSAENVIKLFRSENVPMKVEDGKLRQKFQKITGSWMVKFRGEEITVQQASKYLLETDRKTRKDAWNAIRAAKEKDIDEIEDIYSQMVKLRNQIAKNASFKNYIEYKFKELERFDYTQDDCRKFHSSIYDLIVPAVTAYHRKRAKDLNLDSLRPWDTRVDSKGRAPLKPFKEVSELVDGCETIFSKVDEELGEIFSYMRERELLDLASRKGKAPGGYQTVFSEAREPFIFMNAVGVPHDVETLLHEGGHSFHSFFARDLEPASYRHAGHEFSEVASMSMELLTRNFIDEFYKNDEDRNRYLTEQLYGILEILPWIAMMDAFQEWVYTNPENRPFEVPLYYIEYGIAQLGALQIWLNAKQNYRDAVSSYKRALELGGSKTLPELFKAADAKFDMGDTIVRPIVNELTKELKALEG